jgi:hypothetical protein
MPTSNSRRWIELLAVVLLAGCTSSAPSASSDQELRASSKKTNASCSSASDCSGELPRSCEQCADGTEGCAQWSCVSGGCQITYCSSSHTQTTGCSSASDCNGILPKSCRTCSDGSQGCAAWSCSSSGKCEISYCSGASSGSTPCEAAGGSCVALAPGSCTTGKIGSSKRYSCNADNGIECCLPGSGNACEQAGGKCVPLAPGTCNGTLGGAACGPAGDLGVSCCMP